MPKWLEILLGFVFLARIPTFFEPFYYGDEMIYLTLGNAVRRGLVLYRDIHDNKPPLLYLLAAAAGNVFWFKVILCFWSLFTVVLFWKLAKKLLDDRKKELVATITFAIITTIPLLEGNIVNAENFLVGLVIAAFLIIFSYKNSFKNLFLAGVLVSLAVLFKVPAIFDVGAIVLFWLITKPVDLKKAFPLAVGLAVPILVTFVWYYFRGALPDYVKAAFLQNVGYLSSFRPADVMQPFLVRNGPVLIRGGVVLLGGIILWLKRKTLSKEFIFSTLWLLTTLFAATLSERPYPHYLLQAAAPAAILISFLIYSKNMEQILSLIPLFVLIFVPVYYKFYYYPTFSYYTRFSDLVLGKTTKGQYMSKFDRNTNSNYEIADFIAKSTKPSDRIFVWGDSPTIYALSRRLPIIKYTAAYHVTDFSSQDFVIKEIASQKPVFVVVLAGAPEFKDLYTLLNKDYLLISTIDGSQLWHKLMTVSK